MDVFLVLKDYIRTSIHKGNKSKCKNVCVLLKKL